MKISFCLVTLVSVALCGIVHAAPAPLCDRTNGLCADIAVRHVADSMVVGDLVARTPASTTSKNIIAVQKAQGERQQKTKMRKAEKSRVATQARKDHKAAKTQEWAAKKKTPHQKVATQAAAAARRRERQRTGAPSPPNQVKSAILKAQGERQQKKKMRKAEKSRVATQARKDHKAAKTQEWTAKKKPPHQKVATQAAAAARRRERQRTGAPSPANQVKLAKNLPKMTQTEKQDVKNGFQAARQKFSQTQGMPTRGQTATVGQNSANGRAVRQSVFNNYLHENKPIGRKRLPKNFKNHPYSATHGDTSLRNTRPLPQGGSGFKEYPVINSPTGWTGTENVGALRTITYNLGGQRHAAVVGHDNNRGGTPGDHYVATIARELESSDVEDFE